MQSTDFLTLPFTIIYGTLLLPAVSMQGVGASVGRWEGTSVNSDGAKLGRRLGLEDGNTLGVDDGDAFGRDEGLELILGREEGISLGC